MYPDSQSGNVPRLDLKGMEEKRRKIARLADLNTQGQFVRTRFHRLDGLGFRQLEGCDPLLPLDLGRRLDVEGLRAAVAHDEGAGVHRVY